ncbi:MAG: Uma2 family endonuclease [Bacteroidota bacterium]
MDNTSTQPQNPEQEEVITISKKEFLSNYTGIQGGYKYEWNNGIVEKSKDMSQYVNGVFVRILQTFAHTEAYRSGGGIISQVRMSLPPNQVRQPEIAFYTKEMIMKESKESRASWVAEIVAAPDHNERVAGRVAEYFNGGAQSVWIILPESKQVEVFTAPAQKTTHSGPSVCSAAPAIDGLEIPAEQLFA